MPTPAVIVLHILNSTVVATSSGAPAVVVNIGHVSGLEDRVHFITIIV